MLQTFNQIPHRLVKRRRNTRLRARFDDRSIHEIHFGLPPGEYVLQHRSAVLAGRIRSFLDKSAGVAVQLDSECSRYGFSLGDEIGEQLARRRKTRRSAVMQ